MKKPNTTNLRPFVLSRFRAFALSFLRPFVLLAFCLLPFNIFAQHLFLVSYNELSENNITHLKSQISVLNSQISILNSQISISNDSKIIILNEDNGAHVVITPVKETLTEFQLSPFFMEELRQGALGDADRYLIVETLCTTSLQVLRATSVSVGSLRATTLQHAMTLPRYFYGKKENVKEALPQDRQIIGIYKQKPQIILADPDDVEMQRYAAQKEEETSYYIYMYQLPDGAKCTYAEHFNKKNDKNLSSVGNFLEFNLTGELDDKQRLATEYALELWGEQLAGAVPVAIEVDFFPMGPGVLGRSFFPTCFNDGVTNVWYPSALWDQIVGYDYDPGENDNTIWMNSDYKFYLGLDGLGSGMDFVTIALHEVTHGLGFGCYCSRDDGEFFWGGPGIYDCQLYKGLDGPCFIDLPNYERTALMVSNNMYAGGPGSNLLAANGGERVKIYAPTSYSSGSSAHHWDSSVGFPTFMKYAYDYPLHTFNNRKLGILTDMGWELPIVDTANAVWVTFNNNGGAGNRNPQPFIQEEIQRLKICPFSKTGHTFKEWNTLPDGTGQSYADRDSITIREDTEFYAQWEANTYTLTFSPNGGTVSPTSKEVVYGLPVGELPIPEKTGYTFTGWRIGASVFITEETIWEFTTSRPVQAQWTLNQNIEEIQLNTTLQIIPNPASNTIELRIMNYELRVDDIEFYSISGQLVKSVSLAGEMLKDAVSQKIDISDLRAGVYFAKAGDNIVKLVVQ